MDFLFVPELGLLSPPAAGNHKDFVWIVSDHMQAHMRIRRKQSKSKRKRKKKCRRRKYKKKDGIEPNCSNPTSPTPKQTKKGAAHSLVL